MKKLLVVLAVLAGIVLSGCVRENDMAEPVIFAHCWDYETSDWAIWSFDAEGVFVNKWTVPCWNQENNLCVDSSHNVYMTDIAGGAWNVIKKWDKNGTLLKSKTTDWTEGIAIGPDGYLYTRQLGLEEFGETYVIVKRDPDTLEAVSHIVMPNVSRWFTFDSDGYFYIRDKVSVWGIAKWDYDSATRIAFHTVSFWNNWCSSAYTDGLVAFSCDGCGVSTIPTSLDEDPTHWTGSGAGGSGASIHIGAVDSLHFIVAETTGSHPNTYYNIRKYTSAGSVVWDKNIEHTDNITVYGLAAYPFYVVDKEAPWKEDILLGIEGSFGGDDWNGGFGIAKVEIPRRSGQWTQLGDVMRIHTSNGKNPFTAVEIGQAEITVSNISKNFNSFNEASDWYKSLEGYAAQIKLGCTIGGSPVSVELFTGIISAADADRASQTAEIKLVDFLDYFGRVTIKETPVWVNISLTQLFKNLVELAFPEWVEGTDYFVEDLGGSTIPAIGYEKLNLLNELKMIAESRGKRIYTDVSARLHCAAEPEGEPLIIKHDYNLEHVRERRDINSVLNWVIVHARPHEIKPDLEAPGKIAGFTATPGDLKIDLSWSNPTDDDFEKVLIRYSTTAYPLNRDDGTQIYEGTGEAKEHTGLTNGQRYYYSAWTKDTTGNWSDAAQTSGIAGVGGDTWADDTETSRVSMFGAEPQSQKIILTWYNPNIANFEKVVIRRSTTSYPDSPTSGDSAYDGTAETTTDTGLANGTRYYYSAFVKNTVGDYSGAAFASAETPSTIRTRKMIQSQKVTGYGILGPQTGAYGTSYSKKVLLRFGGLGGKYSTDWLRFKHEWDIKVNSGPKYSSNQKHEYGVEDDLGLGFTKNIGGVAGVTVTKVRVTTSEVQVEYKLVYIGGKALSISFSNKLSLWG